MFVGWVDGIRVTVSSLPPYLLQANQCREATAPLWDSCLTVALNVCLEIPSS